MKNIKKMKKVSIKLAIVPLLMSLCSFKVNNDYDKELVNNIFTSLTYMDEGFVGSSISSPIKLIDNNDQSCLLFKTYLNNKYTGYFILDNNYELLISHVDSLDYYQDVEDNYYLTDIFTISKDREEVSSKSNVSNMNNNIKFLKTTEKQRVLKSITDEELPNVDPSIYKSYSSSFGSSLTISNVPKYYNSPDEKYAVFPGGGCAPTAGAMLTSFYDMNCSYFNNLYVPNLPLNHDDNVYKVNNVIKEIGTYMGTKVQDPNNIKEDDGATYIDKIGVGLNNYLNSKSLGYYKLAYVDTLLDGNTANTTLVQNLCSGIVGKRNISLLLVNSKNNNSAGVNHTIVLTGYNNYQYAGVTLNVNYGWNVSSNYTITPKVVGGIIYLKR